MKKKTYEIKTKEKKRYKWNKYVQHNTIAEPKNQTIKKWLKDAEYVEKKWNSVGTNLATLRNWNASKKIKSSN